MTPKQPDHSKHARYRTATVDHLLNLLADLSSRLRDLSDDQLRDLQVAAANLAADASFELYTRQPTNQPDQPTNWEDK